MPDVTSVVATLAAIKHSIDVVKAVKDADYDLDKAVLKEKIAVLIDSLLEAKIQVSETLDVIQEKDKRITELEEILKFKGQIIRNNDRYFELDENNLPINDPFCSGCWDSEQKKIYLFSPQSDNDDYSVCPKCKTKYGYPKIYIA